MIKLEYISPEMEVVTLKTQGFLCASIDPDTTDPVEKTDNPSDEDLNW